MRLLVLVAGCTLIVGERRHPPAADMAVGDGAIVTADGGGTVTCTYGGDTVVEASDQIDVMEQADVAAVGGGQFAVAYARQDALYTTIMGTGGDTLTPITMSKQIRSCAAGCVDPRVAPAASGDATVWFSVIDGRNTVLVQVARSSWTNVGESMSMCAVTNLSAGVAAKGDNAIVVNACGATAWMFGNLLGPTSFSDAPLAMEIGMASAPAVLLVGWAEAHALKFGATVAAIEPGGVVSQRSDFPLHSGLLSGLALGVIPGTPTHVLAAYTVGMLHEVWIVPASLGGGSGQGVQLAAIGASVSVHQSLGVAAGPNYFVVTYSVPVGGKPRAMAQLVNLDGGPIGQPIPFGEGNRAGTAPRISYSPDGDVFGAVWVGPNSDVATERLAHMAILKCH